MKKQIIFFSLLLVLSICLFFSNSVVTITHYDLSYNNLPDEFDGYKILQVSDLHSAEYGDNNDILIRKIDAVKPDIVVLTGDMIDRTDTDYDVFLSLCKQITKKYKTYFISGNHEMSLKSAVYKNLLGEMIKNKVNIIDNKKITIKRGDAHINLYGLKYSLNYYGAKKENSKYVLTKEKIEKYIGKTETNDFNILLTHNPNNFESYVDWGADLTLTGHIHGGLIRLPFVGGIYSPDRVFFPKYDSGEYESRNKTMIVNRGIGGKKGFRLFNNPEMVLITLNSSEK